jgi:hypothetical protein
MRPRAGQIPQRPVSAPAPPSAHKGYLALSEPRGVAVKLGGNKSGNCPPGGDLLPTMMPILTKSGVEAVRKRGSMSQPAIARATTLLDQGLLPEMLPIAWDGQGWRQSAWPGMRSKSLSSPCPPLVPGRSIRHVESRITTDLLHFQRPEAGLAQNEWRRSRGSHPPRSGRIRESSPLYWRILRPNAREGWRVVTQNGRLPVFDEGRTAYTRLQPSIKAPMTPVSFHNGAHDSSFG